MSGKQEAPLKLFWTEQAAFGLSISYILSLVTGIHNPANGTGPFEWLVLLVGSIAVADRFFIRGGRPY